MSQFQFQPSSIGSLTGQSKLSQSYLKPSQKGCSSIVSQLGFNSLIKGHQRIQMHLSQKTLNERDIFAKPRDEYANYLKTMSDLLYLLKYRICQQQLLSDKNELFLSMILQKFQIGVTEVFKKQVQPEQIQAKDFLNQFISSRNRDIKQYTKIDKICIQSEIFTKITKKKQHSNFEPKDIIQSFERELKIDYIIKYFLIKVLQTISYSIYLSNKKNYKRSQNEIELLLHTIVFMLFNFSKDQYTQVFKRQSVKSCDYLQLVSKDKGLRLIMKFLDDIPDDLLAKTIKQVVNINRSLT